VRPRRLSKADERTTDSRITSAVAQWLFHLGVWYESWRRPADEPARGDRGGREPNQGYSDFLLLQFSRNPHLIEMWWWKRMPKPQKLVSSN
jgi:hypothetical protein